MKKQTYKQTNMQAQQSNMLCDMFHQIGQFEVMERIGQGSFGQVFLAKHVITNKQVALKVGEFAHIRYEAQIYQYLGYCHNSELFPPLFWFGPVSVGQSYLVLPLLGIPFSASNPLHHSEWVKRGLVQQIEGLHDCFLLHRDIKPSNLLIDEEKETVHLIDFGFCKRFIQEGQHIEENMPASMVGSESYASDRVKQGLAGSRRDDLESCVYLFVKRGSVALRHEALRYVQGLRFVEKPHYGYFLELLLLFPIPN